MLNDTKKIQRSSLLFLLGCTLVGPAAFAKEKIEPYDPTQVRQTQCKLFRDGFEHVGPIDGLYGPLTTAAMTDFQREHELVATGKLNSESLAKLSSEDATRGIATETKSPDSIEQKSPDVQSPDVETPESDSELDTLEE